MKKLIKTIMALFLFGNIAAQNEFIVNTFQDSTQRDPQIARDAEGNYLIVWDSENQFSANSKSDIYFQRFNSNDEKLGNETLVNNYTENEQERPALSMNNDGTFVIAWASHSGFNTIFDIKARLYKNDNPVSDEFLVNTTTINSQTKSDVAINEEGNFVVVWESWYQDGSDKGVYAQLFDSDGNGIGNEFLVNTTTVYSQCKPTVKYFNNGKFIIIWESWKQDSVTPSGYGLYGKIFDSNGNVVKDEFQINSYSNNYQWYGDIETLEDNSFAVTWCSWEQDGFDGGIYLQKFNSNGEKTGNEILVNKTTVYYQWLPRIAVLDNQNIAITWSSWRTDGSREGVYVSLFDEDLKQISFETLANDYTDSFQWEPDLIAGEGNEVVIVWSSWGQLEKDYEIVAKRITPSAPQGAIDVGTYEHTSGESSLKFVVHVIDTLALTGDTYQISFELPEAAAATAAIKNINSGQYVVEDYLMNAGEGVFYLTNVFDGVAVEFMPNFNLELDLEGSYFLNQSGTNLQFEVSNPSTGIQILVPINIEVRWGNTDTLSDGTYVSPLDTAYSITAAKEIILPFISWNVTDDEKMRTFVIEPASTTNNKWDANERIVFITPERYENNFPRFHAELNSIAPPDNIIMPNTGDINYINTKKPLTESDVYSFTTNPEYFTTAVNSEKLIPGKFVLNQNYPNPFNPSTIITYSIPEQSFVSLKIYDILGREVAVLVNNEQRRGNYSVELLSNNLPAGRQGLASGIYFYRITAGGFIQTKKMILLR